MKQSSKNFEGITKNSPISKAKHLNDDQKLKDCKSKLSECSEHESDLNGDGSGNRGFSSSKPNPASFRKKAPDSNSCFAKVNLLAQGQGNGYTGARNQGKENTHHNLGGGSQDSEMEAIKPISLEANSPDLSTEARIRRFLKNLSKKYSEFIKGTDKKSEEKRNELRKFEDYVRGLEGKELDEFLTSYETQYTEEQKEAKEIESAPIVQEEEDVDMDNKSEESEIPQEEIVMMTNLESTISTQGTIDRQKSLFEEKAKVRMDQESLVPIDMKLIVDGLVIKDQFLWEASNTDSSVMRLFALQLLSEKVGRTGFTYLSSDVKRRFAESVSEIILYNVNIYNKLNMRDLIGKIHEQNKQEDASETKDESSKAQAPSTVHPIVKVNIRIHRENGEHIEDSLFWDLTCDLNNPELFAQEYCRDLSLTKIHEKQISFAIRKQVFDHLKQVNLMQKYNLLKSLGIPVNKEMVKGASKSMAKNKEMNIGEGSEMSENDMYIPQDFFSSYNNMDDDKPSGDKNSRYGYYGSRRYCGKDKRKKSLAPKEISLIVRRIHPDEISQDGSEEERMDQAIQYCCELLLVGNRRTRIVQRKQKAKNNRRTCLKRTVIKRTPDSGFTKTRKESEDQKSEVSESSPRVVQEVIAEAEDNSSEESEPQLVTGIIGEIESNESEEESSQHKEDGSENNTTSHV